ncbi:MAG: hypothetical protein H6881_08365 [Rhodobiaceae bacterium]|nr:hypothetical protein [Rhodobiaceae bacterium]MCC0051877.1 hypothetical protein [Rhodobiaceae bacterium]
MYGTIADWRTYAAARGNDAPTSASDELATEALVRASDYIQWSYVARFVLPYDATADGVEEATYEAANLELATPGFFSKTFTTDQQKVLTEVRGIKWTPVKSSSTERSAQMATPRSTLIDAMLARYMPTESGFAPWFTTIGAPDE